MTRRQRYGFTWVELMVAQVIIVILGAVLLMVYLMILRGLAISTTKAMVTSKLRNALEQVGRDVEHARNLPATCPGGTYPVSATQLVLDIPGVADCVVYRCSAGSSCTLASPGQLERILAPGGGPATQTRMLTRDVTALSFTRANRHADIRLGVSETIRGFRTEGKIVARYVLRGQ